MWNQQESLMHEVMEDKKWDRFKESVKEGKGLLKETETRKKRQRRHKVRWEEDSSLDEES